MKIDTLERLFVHELKDLHSAEKQLHAALPAWIDAASDDDLTAFLRAHREETEIQIRRLEGLFEKTGFEPGGEKCEAADGLLKEAKERLASIDDPHVRDAGLISAAQRFKHYEMAAYGTAATFAEKLGKQEATDALRDSLDEEAAADRKLTRLAERRVNFVGQMARP